MHKHLGWDIPTETMRLNEDEFIEHVEKYLGIEDSDEKQNKVDMFHDLDENGDQKLTPDEILGYFTQMGATTIPEQVIRAAV